MSRATATVVPDADSMRELGAGIAARCLPGDVVVLLGPLGAGKTTFTQGFARGLQVMGAVTSPTFVIARVHRSTIGGPDLVHVDAYRLGGLDELDELDLATSLDDSVTVVEWGEGVAEQLGVDAVCVRIERDDSAASTGDGAVGARRVHVDWPAGRS